MDRHKGPSALRRAFQNAFAIPQDDPLSQKERQWLEGIAERVVRRGLAAPAVLLLQTAKPLSFLGSQLIVFVKPLVSMILPAADCDQAAELLSRRHSIETLLQMIEQRDAERGSGAAEH